MNDWWKKSRFFFVSLVIHFTIVAILAVWTLPTVIHIIVTKVHEAEAGAQPFDDNQHQSSERGLEQWEKLSDYKGEQQPQQRVARQTTDPYHVPLNKTILGAQADPTAQRALSANKIVVVEARQKVSVATRPLLPRDQMTRPQVVQSNEVVQRTRPTPQAEFLVEEPAIADPQRRSNPLPAPSNPGPAAERIRQQARTIAAQQNTMKPKVVAQERGPSRRREVAAVIITEDQATPIRPLKKQVEFMRTRDVPLPQKAARAGAPPTADRRRSPSPRPKTQRVKSSLNRATPTVQSAAVRRLGRPQLAPSVLEPAEQDARPQVPTVATKPAPQRTPSPALVPLGRRSLPQRFRASISSKNATDRPRRLSIGTLSSINNKAAPIAGKVESRLMRKLAKAKPVTYAEDSVGMQQMFVLRQADVRRQYIELFGGTKDSETAVSRGLAWIAQHQHPDGRWCLNRFHENCRRCKHPNCSGAGSVRSDTAGTALGLLPLLGAGNTHKVGKYRDNVARGWQYLKKIQKKNGDLLTPGDAQHMYSHCLATIAICELYGMSKDESLKSAAQRAVQFIAAARHKGTGGWRYVPGQPADTSVVGWAVMALKSAEMAGLKVPQDSLAGAAQWLKRVEGSGGGTFGYQNKSVNRTMTAEGLLCLQFLGAKRNSPRMRAGADYLLKHLPKGVQNNNNTSYFWYYGTQAMYHMQGTYWETWNKLLRDRLVKSQVKTGGLTGTWAPKDNWEGSGGRLYATSIKLLMLEVYYRHLPLYELLE